MDPKQLFSQALNQATAVVDTVEPEDFTKLTPAKEWNVRRLASHMLRELCWVSDMVAGKTADEVGNCYRGDLIGEALQANWHATAGSALEAVTKASLTGTVHTPDGDISVAEYLRQVGSDLLIHAWDMGEGIGKSIHFDTSAALAAHEYLLPKSQGHQYDALFAPPIKAPDGADIQTRLLALCGRRVNWPAM